MTSDGSRERDLRQAATRGRWSTPATTSGRLALALPFAAILVILAINLIVNPRIEGDDDDLGLVRLLLALVFAFCSAGGLLSAVRAIRSDDRGVLVWLGGLVGLLGTLLVLAELTVME